MKCLKVYNSINEFNDFVEKELNIEKWLVMSFNPQGRIKQTEDKKYYKKLKLLAQENDINASKLEIISWLDTLNELYCTLDGIENFYPELKIIQELELPFTKKRTDYILCYNNKLLILEFSSSEYNKNQIFNTKLSQAVNYKELLANCLPPDITIGTYTFLISNEYMYEPVKITSKFAKEEKDPNYDKRIELNEYIKFFFIEDNIDYSYNELSNSCRFIENRFKSIKQIR